MPSGAPSPTSIAAEAREQVIRDRTLSGRELCTALTAATDEWLIEVFASALGETGTDPNTVSLCAVGGYGRGDLCPGSDLDVLLIHEGDDEIERLASATFYPIWDAGVKLGHSVRTVSEARSLASTDIETATSLIQLRHLAGSRLLSQDMARRSEADWDERGIDAWVVLAKASAERHAGTDQIAFLLEPDLKNGRGGLRDINVARWADRAAPLLSEEDLAALEESETVLLETRVALHRVTGRPHDLLTLEQQDAVAAEIRRGDADVLMARVAAAARETAWVVGDTITRAMSRAETGRTRRFGFGRRSTAETEPIGHHMELAGGMIRLVEDAPVESDPFLGLTVARMSAERELRIERPTLDRLAEEGAMPPEVWSAEDRERLIEVLAFGRPAIAAIEALEHHELFTRLIPEWEPNRSRPQRNAYHRFTVDRHLLETAATAASFLDRVSRPDLLLLGALFHDIGKGFEGDHTEVGIELIHTIGPRMGLDAADTESVAAMIRHHLLLPDVATRRDLDDEGTISMVAEAVGSRQVLELLDALTRADSLSTGPSAWSDWKAGLIDTLVARVGHVLQGGEVAEAAAQSDFPSSEQARALAVGDLTVQLDGERVWLVAPDAPGVFSRVAGAVAINGLGVLEANANSENGMALAEWTLASELNTPPDKTALEDDIRKALTGRLAVAARVAARTRTYGRPRPLISSERTEVQFDLEISDVATVIQVIAPDCPGVLYRMTRALAQMDININSAKAQTLGTEVVDSFYVTHGLDDVKFTDTGLLAEVERALLHAVDEALSDAGTPRLA